jgi:hypothetical protein
MTDLRETDRGSSFGYPMRSDQEVGFYVVCSDRMILDNINSLLKKKGMIGISDTAGRIHYMVDARKNVYAAANRIAGEAVRNFDLSSVSNTSILEVTEETLTRNGMDRSLIGTRILRTILLQSIRDPSLLTVVSKRLYPLVAREFGISVSQVERNLRYSLSRTKLYRDGLRNVHIIQKLFDDISIVLMNRYDPGSCQDSVPYII